MRILLQSIWHAIVRANLLADHNPLHRREYFYTGGTYNNITVSLSSFVILVVALWKVPMLTPTQIGNSTGRYMLHQIYVEKLTPLVPTKRYPIILYICNIHLTKLL